MPHRFHPNSVHIRNVMLFLFLSGTKPPETHRQLARVYPQEVPSEHTVRNWFKRFEAHNYNLEDEERSQPARVMDLDLLRSTVEGDPFATTREIAQTLRVDQATVVRGLQKLGKVRKLGRWIPHVLSDKNKNCRVDTAMSLLTYERTTAWLDNLITGDEKWIVYHHVVRRAQWVDKEDQPEPVAKDETHQKKVMLSVWWGVQGPIYWELLPEGTTITGDVYARQLRDLKAHVQSTPWLRGRLHFLHDNARPHVCKQVKKELTTFGWHIVPHAPYSPDMAPSDYWLFSDMQRVLGETHFKNRAEVDAWLKTYFASKQPAWYGEGIRKLPIRWQKTVDSDGEYFI